MTPTLFGRWQTRTFLLLTFGLLFTLPFVIFFRFTPLVILAMVLFFGYFWDLLYMVIQGGRWDRDWPPAYQFFAGVWEGIVVFLITLLLRRFVAVFDVSLPIFLLHYGSVWVVTFLMSQSLMRILFPDWRYHGGQIVG